ncbi:IS66 family transposase [Verrucomicrobia bacterium S94]|nr:IS66 family transposase [Verrucomicrobia bacterium S94]
MDFNRENFDLLLEKSASFEALESESEQLKSKIKILEEKVQYLLKKLFGRSSEKLSPDQMELAFEELYALQKQLEEAEESADEMPQPEDPKDSRRGKRKPLKERVPEDLPVERVVIIPDEVQEEPELYKKIGEETVEELDVVPSRYFRRIIVREKYVLIDDREAAPVIAPAPERLIQNSYASAGLIAQIILNKYCDHLPLYRQEWILKYRYDIEVSRKTMGNWMYLTANWLTMIYESLRNEIRQSGYIQADETVIKHQDKQKDYCPNGYLWVYHSPGVGALFEWFASRANECLDGMLTDFSGYLQSDGYEAYPCWLNKPDHTEEKESIIHAGCWAHARRKFVEAGDSISRKIVKHIAKLYRIETDLRKTPELDRSAVRQKDASPILEKLKTILEREKTRQLPKSKLGEAIRYTLSRWDSLTHYVDHSRLEIDNNLVENAIRPTAIGKKNFLFFGSPDSGQTSAVIYSLVETCRKLDINPADYLREVLDALPTMDSRDAPDWTPAQWKARRENAEPAPSSKTLSASREAA